MMNVYSLKRGSEKWSLERILEKYFCWNYCCQFIAIWERRANIPLALLPSVLSKQKEKTLGKCCTNQPILKICIPILDWSVDVQPLLSSTRDFVDIANLCNIFRTKQVFSGGHERQIKLCLFVFRKDPVLNPLDVQLHSYALLWPHTWEKKGRTKTTALLIVAVKWRENFFVVRWPTWNLNIHILRATGWSTVAS